MPEKDLVNLVSNDNAVEVMERVIKEGKLEEVLATAKKSKLLGKDWETSLLVGITSLSEKAGKKEEKQTREKVEDQETMKDVMKNETKNESGNGNFEDEVWDKSLDELRKIDLTKFA